jgi:hypothetical protein
MISLLSHGDEEQEQWAFAHCGRMKQATGTDSDFNGLGSEQTQQTTPQTDKSGMREGGESSIDAFGSEHSSAQLWTAQYVVEGHHSGRLASDVHFLHHSFGGSNNGSNVMERNGMVWDCTKRSAYSS